MVWNDAVVPLVSIEGGACRNGRGDGLCGLEGFKANLVSGCLRCWVSRASWDMLTTLVKGGCDVQSELPVLLLREL